MKITKDIWILLTEYDELNQIEIIFYKNSTSLVKPYLYYTNKNDASLLKMDENDFVYFSKIDIEKNSEFKFAIIGEQEVIKYEIYLGKSSEDCYLIKEEKCDSEFGPGNSLLNDNNNNLLAEDVINECNSIISELIDPALEELDELDLPINEINNTEDIVETESEEPITETIDDVEDIVETEFDEPITETIDTVENTAENEFKENDDTIINNQEINDINNVDTVLENLIKDFTMPIDISNTEIKNNESDTNDTSIETAPNETINIEDTNKLNVENIFNISNNKNNSIIDNNISFQNIIDTIDNFDFSFKNIKNDEKNSSQENIFKHFINDSINKSYIDIESYYTTDLKFENILKSGNFDNNKQEETNSYIESGNNENNNEDTQNGENILFEWSIVENTNDEINNKNDATDTTNEVTIKTNSDYENNQFEDNIYINNNSLIVSQNKGLKSRKRHGLSFSYKMNKKIKIALIKLYRVLPNFLKGDYRRRINL